MPETCKGDRRESKSSWPFFFLNCFHGQEPQTIEETKKHMNNHAQTMHTLEVPRDVTTAMMFKLSRFMIVLAFYSYFMVRSLN